MNIDPLAMFAAVKMESAIGGSVGDKRNRNPNWTDQEIVRFLEMLEEDGSVADMVANRNRKVFCSVAARLVEEGADKTWDQCRIKLKNLKSQYRYVKERIPDIDDLDLEDDAVVKRLVQDCQAKAISPSCIKHLRLLMRFLKKHKRMATLLASSTSAAAAAATAAASGLSGSSVSITRTTGPISSDSADLSSSSSPHPGLRLISELTNGTADAASEAHYKLIEKFNRDMMDQFMEHQRTSREALATWEQERWRQEKECMERWKNEARDHERQLFSMFCTAMVKCNAALTAVLQSKPIPEQAEQSGWQEEATDESIDVNDPEDDDEAYEMQQEIQNMVHVTMDVQDSEISC